MMSFCFPGAVTDKLGPATYTGERAQAWYWILILVVLTILILILDVDIGGTNDFDIVR